MSYYHKKAPKKNLPLVIYGQDAHQVQRVQKNLPKLMILVVGETARAESFSKWVCKNTNPELSNKIFAFRSELMRYGDSCFCAMYVLGYATCRL